MDSEVVGRPPRIEPVALIIGTSLSELGGEGGSDSVRDVPDQSVKNVVDHRTCLSRLWLKVPFAGARRRGRPQRVRRIDRDDKR